MVKTVGNPEGRILPTVVTLLFAISLLCLSVVAVFGQNSATAGAGFLRFAPDAVHQGMGRTGTGERFNTNAAFWNIAAAAPEYQSSANRINADAQDATNSPKYFALSAQLPPIGFRDALLVYGTLQGIRLGSGSLVISGTYFRIFQNSVNEYAVSLGYAQPLSEEVSMGIQMKYVQSNLPLDSAARAFNIGRTIGMDIGIVYTPTMLFGTPTSKRISFGAVLKNVGPSVTYNQFADPQPVEFRTGVAAEVFREDAHTVRVLGDVATLLVNRTPSGSFDAVPIVLVTGWRNPLEISIGGEYSYQRIYFARAGYFEDFSQFFSFRRISIGAGARLGNVAQVDVAADIPLQQVTSGSALSAVSLTVRVPIGAGL